LEDGETPRGCVAREVLEGPKTRRSGFGPLLDAWAFGVFRARRAWGAASPAGYARAVRAGGCRFAASGRFGF
jgi:hypothetical protein